MPKRFAILLAPLVVLLASPAGAFAIEINESFRPQDEFKLDPWIDLGFMSINKAVFYVIVATALMCWTMVYVAKRMQERPNKVQTAVETVFLLMRDNITRGNMDSKMAAKWFPFIGALFLFIWFSNMLGYLPLPTNTEHTVNIFGAHIPSFALYAATANISVPLVLAVVVFIVFNVEGLRAQGPIGYVTAYQLMRNNITGGNMDHGRAKKWFPFIGTIFLFLWFSNIIGYLPLPTNTEHTVNIFGVEVPSLALFAATANLSVPLVLTLVVWVSYHVEGIRAKGFVKYLASWIPAGVEGPARAPIFVIEVISHLVRLVSLSVRLFANILAGHLLILFMGGGLVVLLNLAIFGSVILGLVTGVMAVAFFLFEVGLVATLQAFIFATLTAIYLGAAVAEEH